METDTNPGTSADQRKKRPLSLLQVWDLPTRIFHWLVVALVVVSFVTAKIGGNLMTYHMWSGYAILALLLFRVAWGFAGGRTSRFSAFVRPPAVVLAYARGLFRPDSPRYLGHNPLGGWSIIAMLAALLVQAGTGLFANDDIFTEGPLYGWVSKSTSDGLTRIHDVNQWVIIAVVTLHVLAVFFYLVYKRENLIWPMVTGRKPWEAGADQPSVGSPLRAAVFAVLAAVAVYLLVR